MQVAIDDFGTGYSSLSYLQQMPFDAIKIDKSFIDKIGAGGNSNKICRTIISMAHELGKKAIAEGVETREQVDFLRQNGCDSVQGYFYSRPLPQEEFMEFVEKQDFHTMRRKALEIAMNDAGKKKAGQCPAFSYLLLVEAANTSLRAGSSGADPNASGDAASAAPWLRSDEYAHA